MKNLYTGFFSAFFLLALTACAQTKNVVVQTNSYYLIPTPGTIMADDNGRELPARRDTLFFLYVETTDSLVQWERAWQNDRAFSVTALPVQQAEVPVGLARKDGRQIVLKPAKKNALWRLELSANQPATAAPQALKNGEILLLAKRKNQPFYVKAGPFIEIESPLYQ